LAGAPSGGWEYGLVCGDTDQAASAWLHRDRREGAISDGDFSSSPSSSALFSSSAGLGFFAYRLGLTADCIKFAIDPFIVGRIVLAASRFPRIDARLLGVQCDFGLGEGEMRGRMEVGRTGGLLDHLGPRVFGSRTRQDTKARSDLLDSGFRQATDKILSRHIGDMDVGAERVSSDAGHKPAVAATSEHDRMLASIWRATMRMRSASWLS
jgi:hypothetical protein